MLATIWMARLALALYVGSLLTKRRWLWTSAYVVYLVHVFCAFWFVYGWSHETAVRETARQTRELFGVDSGFGLYLNYLLTAVWGADCVWNWQARAWRIFVHALLAFLFFNASVVVWILKSVR